MGVAAGRFAHAEEGLLDFTQIFARAGEAASAYPASYEPSMVLLSYLIASLAGYAFLRLVARIAELGSAPARYFWLTGGALTMGLGIWAMHFVGMLAYRLPIPVSFDALVTALSAAPAVLASAVAIYIVARPTITMPRLLLGGTFMGAGIGVMHYTGMASMRLDAFVRYDPILFATSIVVAVALAILALQVTFWTKRRSAALPAFVHDVLGASIMGLAVSGMHYTAMTSTLCIPNPGAGRGVLGLDPSAFAFVTATVATVVLLLAIFAVIFDRRLSLEIGKRQQAAARAQSLDQQMIDAIETMPDGLAIFDKDSRFVRCNSHFRETFTGNTVSLQPGTSFEEIIRGRTQFLWPKESGEQLDQRVREALRLHRAPDAPHVTSTPNGKWSLTRVRPTADGGAVMVMTDITAVKQAEELLRLREHRLALIMDNVADALITIGPGGTIASFNRSAEQIFGFASAEVIGQRFVSLFTDEEGGAQQGELAKHIHRGESSRVEKGPLEVTGRHKNGRPINIELVMTRAEEGGKVVLIGALRDTTERKAIQAQLQQAQKMEAVGQLTGGIAHDFNNLLGVVIGNLDLLKPLVPANSEEQSLVDAALDSALRGADLNLRLLAFSRRQSLQPEPIDINDVVGGMRDLLQRAIGERIVIGITPGKGIWSVEADLAQLESAVVNLAVNARDAMPEGGTLTIETQNVTIDANHKETHPGAELGEYVCITVSDTGGGMPPEVQARAFEPFFTTKAVGKGSGLGLSMVFGFMKQSNGFVTIYSEVGRGTVVRLYLPRTEKTTTVVEAQEAESGAPTGSERILLVEDNRAMGRVVTRQLQELGYQVVEAADARQALTILERGTPIDLLFTDVVMPGEMDGIGLVHRARNLRQNIKVLLASGFTARATDPSRGDTPLPARLLAKPFRKYHLAQAVRQALDE